MSNNRRRLEKTYYSNGQLHTEVTFIDDDIPDGMTRHWHANGTIKAEIPTKLGMEHGVVRQWSSEGRLLSSDVFTNGTGVSRAWHPNDKIKSELAMKQGIPHGILRVWSMSGEPEGERYYVSGRQVSKKKYLNACETDSSLPRVSINDVLDQSYDMDECDVGETIPAAVDLSLRDDVEDAVMWLKGSHDGSLRTLGEAGTVEESLELVTEFLKAGAVRVELLLKVVFLND